MTAWKRMLSVLVACFVAGVSLAQEGGDTGASSVPDASEATQIGTGSDESEAPASREHMRELRTVEESVHNLKERVFRSKATLQLLRELVIESATMGSGVQIWHVDDLPRAYEMDSVQYFLDGRSIYAWSREEGSKEQPEDIQIRDQTVSSGAHTVQVTMLLRGNGGGLFGYVQNYRFKVQSSYTFEVTDGRLTTLRVRAIARGGVRKSFVDRPTVEYEERVEALQVE